MQNHVKRKEREVAVEALGIEKVYRPKVGHYVHVLRNVSLTVYKGEFVSIVGPSGCGKSTFLRMIANLIQPTGGSLRVLGVSAAEIQRSRLVGFVFQNPVMLPWRNTLENVAFALEVLGVPRRERKQRAREAIARVQLNGFEQAFPQELSGGMRQRAALARVLTLQPSLLLMDEPFSALDELTREQLGVELARVIDELGITTIMVTHNIEEAVLLSDRVFVFSMRPGTICEEVIIPFSRPRDSGMRSLPEFVRLTTHIRSILYRTSNSFSSSADSCQEARFGG